MPSMSLPLHPVQLAGLNPAMSQPPIMGNHGHPGQLLPKREGGTPPPDNTLPAFDPNNPDYAQPAPFNPYLAAAQGVASPPGPMLSPNISRMPMGGFDLAPENRFPARFNPYLSR